MKVVLTKPLSIEEDSNDDNKASNVLKGILSLLKDVRPGSDLTKLQASIKIFFIFFSFLNFLFMFP